MVRVLERVAQARGVPETIQVDNGPEFISQVVDQTRVGSKGCARTPECLLMTGLKRGAGQESARSERRQPIEIGVSFAAWLHRNDASG